MGLGPVDLFASSGGAVNALALVATHPEDVRTLVAHEPPLASILADSANAKGAVQAISDSYQQRGWGAGMAHFIAIVSHRGEFPGDIGQLPPDPATFGMPTEDDGNRTDVMLGQNIVTCTHYQPDFDALRRASTRVVLAAGDGRRVRWRTAAPMRSPSGSGAAGGRFPSHHGGFGRRVWLDG